MWCVHCAVGSESLNKIKFNVIPCWVTHILQTTIRLPHDRQRATVMYVTIWPLTLNLLTTTIVHLLVMLANGKWDLIRRLKG